MPWNSAEIELRSHAPEFHDLLFLRAKMTVTWPRTARQDQIQTASDKVRGRRSFSPLSPACPKAGPGRPARLRESPLPRREFCEPSHTPRRCLHSRGFGASTASLHTRMPAGGDHRRSSDDRAGWPGILGARPMTRGQTTALGRGRRAPSLANDALIIANRIASSKPKVPPPRWRQQLRSCSGCRLTARARCSR